MPDLYPLVLYPEGVLLLPLFVLYVHLSVYPSVHPSVCLSSQISAGITEFVPNMHPGILSAVIEKCLQGHFVTSAINRDSKITWMFVCHAVVSATK